MSDSLRPHELQHARPPCPSPTPGVHSNSSEPIHRVGDAIQPSHPLSSPSPPAPNPSQHQSLFQWVINVRHPSNITCCWTQALTLDTSSEKAMAPNSSTLAWKIPRTEEPGRLQSMGSRRVGHDWATSLPIFPFRHGRRKWQPTPVFLPGESQGQGSLVGCRLWGRTESDTTEAT